MKNPPEIVMGGEGIRLVEEQDYAAALALLNNAISVKNRVSIDEFRPFAPLFRNPTAETDKDEIVQLSKQFQDRFDMFQKITVYDRNPEDRTASLLFTLPPVFTRLKLIASMGASANNALQGFINALALPPNPISPIREVATHKILQVTQNLVDEQALAEHLRLLEEAHTPSKLQAATNKTLDAMEWE